MLIALASRRAAFLAAIALLVVGSGCGASIPLNAAAPIEKKSVFLGTEYQQSGKRIDREDMHSKLENESGPAEELSGQTALAVSSLVLAVAGGGMVGWPLGQAIAGENEPLWVLAGVGAGLIVLSIPLAIVADNKVENAVDAHNRRLRAKLDAMFAFSRAPRRAALLH
jgi:hypothetical protein